MREAQLLKSLKGHDNIIEICGFSSYKYAILMKFITFDFSKIGIDHANISTLKEFMTACDIISDFHGFEHVPY